jgi:tetratricopeptide (TPR) repeat protein
MQAVEKPGNKGNVTTGTPSQPADSHRAEQWLAWIKANERRLTVAGGVLVVLAGAVWFGISAKARRETFARRELDTARLSAESGNLPLAASDLARIVSTYGSTDAGQEASLLLAQVRLLEPKAELAVSELREFIAGGPQAQYRAPAYGILGTALEQVGQFGAAGQAYEDGAAASEYTLVAARLLLDAGRAYMVAADTAAAVRVYQRILDQYGTTGAGAEARLRLAELRHYEEAGAEVGTEG